MHPPSSSNCHYHIKLRQIELSGFLVAQQLYAQPCVFVCLCVCLSVCLSSLFFKASNWMIYWLLTVVLAPYLSDQVFRAWLSSATLRFFSLAEQWHTQKFYIRCFNSDFDAVKSKFGPQNEDGLKNENTLKNEDNLKNKDNL